jgi:hypothetical protein
VLGYLSSAIAYALLLAACLTLWRRRLTGSAVPTAVAAQLAWSLVLAAGAGRPIIAASVVITAEYLRDLAWALVLLRSLGDPRSSPVARIAQRVLTALVVLVALWAAGTFVRGTAAPLVAFAHRYWLWGAFLLSVAGLVLVEQVARNTLSSHHWELK